MSTDNHGTRDRSRDIAIIGMSSIFPKANDLEQFWQNLTDKVDGISEGSDDWAMHYYDPEMKEPARIYTRKGGFIDREFPFDPLDFGIMPNTVEASTPDHFLALHCTREALQDAGYLDREFDRHKTGVVLGYGPNANRGNILALQHGMVLDPMIKLIGQLFPDMDQETLWSLRQDLKKNLPPLTPEMIPGVVANVLTGRIANRFDLMGPNYVVDAACTSSLISLDAAINELRNGRSDMMIAGGVNASMPPQMLMVFSLIEALSRDKVRPFDKNASGVLLGEGIGMFVLKRLPDAERDGDRIYAVIKGMSLASDGKSKGMLAPRFEGEMLALGRAYEETGLDPKTVGLLEAHGTGIPLGDETEMRSIKAVFGGRDEKDIPLGVGGVKSMIGHALMAAGAAGLVKTVLGIYHRVYPPTLCDEVNPNLELDGTQIYINNKTRPWVHGDDVPRRAGINAFGFGGIDGHLVIEEYPDQQPKLLDKVWPHELFAFQGDDQDAIIRQVEDVIGVIEHPLEFLVRDIAYSLFKQLETATGEERLAVIVPRDRAEAVAKLREAVEKLRAGKLKRGRALGGIFHGRGAMEGKLAFLYPGHGAQYPEMFADMCRYFPKVRAWFDTMDRIYTPALGVRPSKLLYPPPTVWTDEQREKNAIELFTSDASIALTSFPGNAMDELVREDLQITPDVMLGHSTGEINALRASGHSRLPEGASFEEKVAELIDAFREYREKQGGYPTGALLTVGAADPDKVKQVVKDSKGELHFVLDNCPNQVMLYGSKEAIDAARPKLEKAGGICERMPFDRAFHTPEFKAFSDILLDRLGIDNYGEGSIPLYSATKGGYYPHDPKQIKQWAAEVWSEPVMFREAVEKLYDEGVRIFVEIGANSNLTAFVNDILAGKDDVLTVAGNNARKSDLEQFYTMLGQLFTAGRTPAFAGLYSHRTVNEVPLRVADVEEPKYRPTRKPVPLDPVSMTFSPDFIEQFREQFAVVAADAVKKLAGQTGDAAPQATAEQAASIVGGPNGPASQTAQPQQAPQPDPAQGLPYPPQPPQWPVDAYGNPVPADPWGNPWPLDAYGNLWPADPQGYPVPADPWGNPWPVDMYGNLWPADPNGVPLQPVDMHGYPIPAGVHQPPAIGSGFGQDPTRRWVPSPLTAASTSWPYDPTPAQPPFADPSAMTPPWPVDAWGNPVPTDPWGNPWPLDPWGNLWPVDQYGQYWPADANGVPFDPAPFPAAPGVESHSASQPYPDDAPSPWVQPVDPTAPVALSPETAPVQPAPDPAVESATPPADSPAPAPPMESELEDAAPPSVQQLSAEARAKNERNQQLPFGRREQITNDELFAVLRDTSLPAAPDHLVKRFPEDAAPKPLSPRPTVANLPEKRAFPLLGEIIEQDEDHLVATRTFDRTKDPVLDSHTFGGPPSKRRKDAECMPVVPFVMSLETCTEAAVKLLGDGRFIKQYNMVRGHRWLALTTGSLDVEIKAKKIKELDGGDVLVRAEIYQFNTAKDGSRRPHLTFEAMLVLGNGELPAADPMPFHVSDARYTHFTDEMLYNEGVFYTLNYTGRFHGRHFRAIRHIRHYSPHTIEVEMEMPEFHDYFADIEQPVFQTNMHMMDGAILQVGLWYTDVFAMDTNVFPFMIKKIQLFGGPPEPGRKLIGRAVMRFTGIGDIDLDRKPHFNFLDRDGNVIYQMDEESKEGFHFPDDYYKPVLVPNMAILEGNVDVLDADTGQVVARMEGWQNRFFDVPMRYDKITLYPRTFTLSFPWMQEKTGAIVYRNEPFYDGLLEGSFGVWGSKLAHCVLTDAEKEQYYSFKTGDPRREDWLMGRIAAKEALVQWIVDHTDEERLAPIDIETSVDEHGRPHARCLVNDEIDLPPISVSHSKRWAVAAVSEHGGPVGVDYEWIDRFGYEDVLTGGFNDANATAIRALPETQQRTATTALWCCKEAAAKANGTGMQHKPRDWHIVDYDLDAGTAMVQFEQREFPCRFWIEGEEVLALCELPPSADSPDRGRKSHADDHPAAPMTATQEADSAAGAPAETGETAGAALVATEGVDWDDPEREPTALERQLIDIWEQLLDVEDVGLHDDFFELGGESVLAVRLIGRVEKLVGRTIPVANFLKTRTVAQMAQILSDEDWEPDWSCLVPVRTEGHRTPLFIVHPVGGNILHYRDLIAQLPEDQPLYAFQARGLDGEEDPFNNVPEMAEYYLKAIRAVQEAGPYMLAGFSGGGVIAWEMAKQFEEAGDEVALLAMFDSYGPGYFSFEIGGKRLPHQLETFLWRIQLQVETMGTLTSMKDRWRYLVRKVKHGNYKRRKGAGSTIRHVEDVTYEAVLSYEPRPLQRTPVTLFKASVQPKRSTQDPDLNWRPLVENLETHEIPGAHGHLVEIPHVDKLSTVLTDVLTRAHKRISLRAVS